MLYPARYTEAPEGFTSDADWFIPVMELAWKTAYGTDFEFDEWQVWLIRNILRTDESGDLFYRQCLISMPRQQGKTEILSAIALWALLRKAGVTNLGVASTADQARLIYERLYNVIIANPSLSKRMAKITDTRGIQTTAGSKYIIRASNSGSLQGIPVDLGVIDEVHLVSSDVYTAVLSGTGSRKNTIVMAITTAGNEDSELLLHLYENAKKAIDGDPAFESFGAFIYEASQAFVPESDEELLELLMESNPALECGRIDPKVIMADVRSMNEQEVIRYRLNRFIDGNNTPPWMAWKMFEEAGGEGITEKEGQLVLAVDRSSSWGYVTIAAARKLENGHFETELVATMVNPSEDEVFQKLYDLYMKYTPAAIAVDDGMMPNISKKLKLSGIPSWSLWVKELKAATAHAYWAFSNGMVAHNNDPLLAKQIIGAVPKFSGDSVMIDRKNSREEVDAVVATIMAIYVASTVDKPNVQFF